MTDDTDDSGTPPSDPPPGAEVTPVLRYDLMVQDAMHSVVREALDYARRCGLPAGHHFFITFATGHPGVDIPERLLDKFPEEMTIVIQHEFWDLEVVARWFSISMNFNSIPANLTIPYRAITSFHDPYVKFGLQFTVTPPEEDDEQPGEATATDSKAADEAKAEPASGGVVSLDAFRKK